MLPSPVRERKAPCCSDLVQALGIVSDVITITTIITIITIILTTIAIIAVSTIITSFKGLSRHLST